MTERHFPRLDPLRRHSGQYFGQRRALEGKVKVFPHFRHFLVMVCTGRYFALHSWQQSGQLWTFSGRVKVFPHILHVLVIVPRSAFFGCRSLSANSFFNHANIVFAPLISAVYCFLLFRGQSRQLLNKPYALEDHPVTMLLFVSARFFIDL